MQKYSAFFFFFCFLPLVVLFESNKKACKIHAEALSRTCFKIKKLPATEAQCCSSAIKNFYSFCKLCFIYLHEF